MYKIIHLFKMDTVQIFTNNHKIMSLVTLLITTNSTSFGETDSTRDADNEEELSFKVKEIINEDAETSSDTVGDEVTEVVQMLTEVSNESGELSRKESMEEQQLSFRIKDSAETETDLDTSSLTTPDVLVEATTDAFIEPGITKHNQIGIIYIETRGESSQGTWIIIGTTVGIAAIIIVITIVILIIYQRRKRTKSKTTKKREDVEQGEVQQQLIEPAMDPAAMDTSTMDTSVTDPLKTNSST